MLFAVRLRRIVKVLPLQGLQKQIVGAFSRFMRPKSKLFAVHFNDLYHPKAKLFAVMYIRIWEVFALQGLQETCSGRIFTISRVHKSLLCCSGPLQSP